MCGHYVVLRLRVPKVPFIGIKPFFGETLPTRGGGGTAECACILVCAKLLLTLIGANEGAHLPQSASYDLLFGEVFIDLCNKIWCESYLGKHNKI